MAEEKETKKKESERYEVVDYPTQTAPLISDGSAKSQEERFITTELALAKILNNQEKILSLLK